MIGVLTTFYGYKGKNLTEKVEDLIQVFESINLQPFVQLLSSSEGEVFDKVVIRLKELRKKYGVEYSVHGSVWLPNPNFFLNLGSSDKKTSKKTISALKKSIDFAKNIKARNVSFHGGYAANLVFQQEEFQPLEVKECIPYKEAYSNLRDNLKELLKYASEDIELSIENLNYRPEKRYLFSQPEDFKFLPKEVGILFDVGHVHYSQQKLKDLSYTRRMINKIGGRITEIHLSDNDGLEDEHRLPGMGSIPILDIFQQISERQKLPAIIIEAFSGKNGYSEADLKNSIKELVTLIKNEKY